MTKQIIPFNESRLAACLAYLSAKHSATIDKYEAVKLHVMIDVLHALKCGMPVIGGHFEPWTHGPLDREALITVQGWLHSMDQSQKSDLLLVVKDDEEEMELKAAGPANDDDFSQNEISAMEEAWRIVTNPDRSAVKAYFHSNQTPIGSAFQSAQARGDSLNWETILDACDQKTGSDSRHLKAIIGL